MINMTFLWGSASASYQCEGAYNIDGRIESIWDKYLHENNYENGDIASDHYHHFKQDIKMMKDGGQNAYRFSIAWPRILDENGNINPKGIHYYHEMIDCCKENGIEPFVTLYHWDLPQYLEDEGGWLNRNTCIAFEKYAQICFKEYGDKVTYWTTFNEPKWFVTNGYLIGNYPPGLQDGQKMIQAAYHVMLASAMAVRKFKELSLKGKIGIVHSFGPVDGIDDSPATKKAMRYADNYANNWVLDTAVFGEFPADLIEDLKDKQFDLSFINDSDLQIIKENTVDFLGLNYYARLLVKPYTTGDTCLVINNSGASKKGSSVIRIKDWFEQIMNDPNAKYTAWDTEIYPKGIHDGLLRVKDKYNLPVFITENGLGMKEDIDCTMVEDDYRIEFLKEHIEAILQAKEEGADVCGYFVWSPFDLYSWRNGVQKRYGLVAVDFENNLQRRPKKSWYWYRDWIKAQNEQ